MIGEGELLREARRILRKLASEDAVLLRIEDGRFVVHREGRPERARLYCAAAFVAGFRTRDWIAPLGTVPESFRLSEAGAAWLRRVQADGDPYAAQHQSRTRRLIVDAQGIERMVMANEAESPLEWMKSRRLVDPSQFEAGERLRRDYTLAQLAPRLGVDLTAQMVLGKRGAKHDQLLSDTVLAAKQRFARAMKAAGPVLSDLLFDVCCHLIRLEDAEREFAWPKSAARVVLLIALDRLALHYGLTIQAPRRARMRSWREE